MEQDNHMDHEEDAQSDSDLSSTSAASFDQKQHGLAEAENNVKSRHASVPDKACTC